MATTQEILAQANVSAIHYSKNFPLVDGSTPYHYIKRIKEANIQLSLDTNQTDYRNEGHSYRWHCNSYEIVFYDKIRDLQKAQRTSKRAIERDSTLQLDIFNKLKRKKKFEVLRMEVRLNKRDKMKQLFAKLNIKAHLTFKKLFKPAISRKVLTHYLDEVEAKRPMLLDFKAANDKALLAAMLCNNPELSPKAILQMYGLRKALEIVTIRELRFMVARYKQRSWFRLMADAKKIRLPMQETDFEVIRDQLESFKAVRLAKYQR